MKFLTLILLISIPFQSFSKDEFDFMEDCEFSEFLVINKGSVTKKISDVKDLEALKKNIKFCEQAIPEITSMVKEMVLKFETSDYLTGIAAFHGVVGLVDRHNLKARKAEARAKKPRLYRRSVKPNTSFFNRIQTGYKKISESLKPAVPLHGPPSPMQAQSGKVSIELNKNISSLTAKLKNLFKSHGRLYWDKTTAPLILGVMGAIYLSNKVVGGDQATLKRSLNDIESYCENNDCYKLSKHDVIKFSEHLSSYQRNVSEMKIRLLKHEIENYNL